MSIKSISVDETPDLEYRNLLEGRKAERLNSYLEGTSGDYIGEVSNALNKLCVSRNASLESAANAIGN